MTVDDMNLLQQAVTEKKANHLYLKWLKKTQDAKVISSILDIHHQVFDKTDCLACANCCKTTPALMTPDDVNRLAHHLGISKKQFTRLYLIEDFNGDMVLNRVPCHFLQKDHICAVYDLRPDACRRYPHTDEKEYLNRTDLNIANTIVCPAAYRILSQIKTKIPMP
jgi:Fe-S-cluster containining protein